MNVVVRQRNFAVLLLPLILSACSNGGGVPRPIDAAPDRSVEKHDAADDLADLNAGREPAVESNDDSSDGGPLVEAGRDATEGGADLPDMGAQTAGCLAKRTQEYRVVFQGTGFEAYEGKVVIGRTADSFGANRCLAAGMTRISRGSFHIELVNLTSGVYPRVQAFIDLGEDGTCSPSADPSWASSPAIIGRPLIENLVPTAFVVGTACGSID